jgi:histidinol-phosphate/aromatic aminotransferase/cobyric acid decarboxylase-like protein
VVEVGEDNVDLGIRGLEIGDQGFGGDVADGDVRAGLGNKAIDQPLTQPARHAVAIAAAPAALEDQDWMLQNRAKILATRERLAAELPAFGFHVHPSEANFIWTTHATSKHQELYEQLKHRKILVRYMKFPDALPDGGTLDGLRITIGTDAEIDRVLEVMGDVVKAAT